MKSKPQVQLVAAKIAFNADDYVYSSATVYVGRAVECPLEVVPLEVHGLNWNEEHVSLLG